MARLATCSPPQVVSTSHMGRWVDTFQVRQNGILQNLPAELGAAHTHTSGPASLASCAELLGVHLLPKAYGDSQFHLSHCPCPCRAGLMLRSPCCPHQQQ